MSVPYWRTRDRYYRMLGCRCTKCDKEYFPPLKSCRRCHSKELKEVEMPKIGTLLSYTMQRESIAGFEEQEPMSFGLVELSNGVRIVGQLVDMPYESLRIGTKVKAVFRRIKSDGASGQIFYGYKFGPVRGLRAQHVL